MAITDHRALDTNRRLYKCDSCGNLEPWGANWIWYGAYREIEEDPESIVTACSQTCMDKCAESIKRKKLGGKKKKMRFGVPA